MTVNVLALKKHRREQAVRDAENRAEDELRENLKSASALKWRNPFDIFNLSLEKQIELMIAYYNKLESDEREFLAAYPGKDGFDAAIDFRLEKRCVLASIARLRVSMARGDEPIKVEQR